jgi:FHS family glucose/mannose:H+ symporter-like MFS transporter
LSSEDFTSNSTPSGRSEKGRAMKKQTGQNLLFCGLMTVMGIVANIFHTLADRIVISLGRPGTQAGILISVYALGSLSSVLLSSSLADRVGKRRVIAAALFVMSAGLLVVPASSAFIPILIGLYLFGFGFAPSEGMSSALLGDENPEKAAAWMNISQAGFGVGAILGPLLAIAWLSAGNSWRGPFLLGSVLALFLLFMVLFTGRGRMAPAHRQPAQKMNMFGLLKEKRFVLLMVMMFFYLGYESVAPAYIKQYFIRLGAEDSLASLMISLFWGAMIVGRLLGSLLVGKEIQSIRGYTVFAFLGILLLILGKTLPLRVIAVALIGFGCGPVWPMLITLAARLFPQRSGAAVGMMMLASMSGITLFPFLIGTLPDNPTLTFVFCTILAVLVILVSGFAGRGENSLQA